MNRRRGRLLRALALTALATAMSCGDAPTRSELATPKTALDGGWDPIWAAIQDLWTWCPEIAEALDGMLANGDIVFTDVQGQYNDIAYAFFDGPILLDEEYYWNLGIPEDIIAALAADLMHEAGHAIGHLNDDPNVCCPHHNAFDDGCPQVPIAMLDSAHPAYVVQGSHRLKLASAPLTTEPTVRDIGPSRRYSLPLEV